MKSVSAGLEAVIDAGKFQPVLIYKIKLRDGTIYAYTEHDQILNVDLGDGDGAVDYVPGTITQNSEFDQSVTTRVDSSDISGVTGFIHPQGVDRDAILAGRFDGSEITTARVHWPDPSLGGMIIAVHDAGEVTEQDGQFRLDTRSILDRFNGPVSVEITAECRHTFGDALCGVPLGDKTHSGTITGLVDARTFTVDVTATVGSTFAYGRITFDTGRNSGKTYDILSDNGSGQIALNAPPFLPIAIGDNVTLIEGCNKASDCQRYNNYARFGGFPNVPTSLIRSQSGKGEA